jgi:hypothetical protein
MFIRSKTVNGKTYYQWVENYRENGKIKQRVVKHIGNEKAHRKALRDLKIVNQALEGYKRFPTLFCCRSVRTAANFYNAALDMEKEHPSDDIEIQIVLHNLGKEGTYNEIMQALNYGEAEIVDFEHPEKAERLKRRDKRAYSLLVLSKAVTT